MISPFATPNDIDHTLTDRTSILRFIGGNWELGRIGDHSFDALAGPLSMFDFDYPKARRLSSSTQRRVSAWPARASAARL